MKTSVKWTSTGVDSVDCHKILLYYGTLQMLYCSIVNFPSIKLRPDKYNTLNKSELAMKKVRVDDEIQTYDLPLHSLMC